MFINEAEIEGDELKEYVVIGHQKQDNIVALMDSFDTKEGADTYISIESTQFESEGVEYFVYRRVN